ncbi:MAG TPA: class I SAM-dependent methyltransferase [Caulobacteraceae bacterium]|nr:class I SAM-dependent methyltransferase [Caulobacteraceae bacterium]
MSIGQPSRTALGAAAHRAAHQLLDHRRIFHDPLALQILGQSAQAVAAEALAHPDRRAMRLSIAARSRFAEDALGLAVKRGVRQLVVLGAGLDTFAYRNPHADLRVFEADHPATQAWKRQRLSAAGIELPPSLRFAAVDFETTGLAEGLAGAGFDRGAPAFFSWLGVVVYLSEATVFETLGFIADRPTGSEVVFSYSDPPSAMPAAQAAAYWRRAARVQAIGEPWRTQFEPGALHARLAALGFGEIEDLGPTEVAILYFGAPADAPARKGGHLIRARIC